MSLTKSAWMPNCGRKSPSASTDAPYRFVGAMMRPPPSPAHISAYDTAAMPDDTATAPTPPSRAASRRSAHRRSDWRLWNTQTGYLTGGQITATSGVLQIEGGGGVDGHADRIVVAVRIIPAMNRKRAEISHFQIPFIRMTAKTTNTDRHISSSTTVRASSP